MLWWALLTIAVWHLYGLISIVQTVLAEHILRAGSAPSPGYFARVLFGTGSEVWFRILSTPLIVLYVRWVTRLTRHWSLRVLLLVCAAIGSVFIAAAKGLLDAGIIFGRDLDYTVLVASGFDYNLHVFLATALIVLLRQYWTSYDDERRRASELNRRLTDAELTALRLQLQPHFLSNTLNSFAATVHRQPDSADQMITNLGDLLRRSLNERRQEVPLHE